jgi:hypothetical protein
MPGSLEMRGGPTDRRRGLISGIAGRLAALLDGVEVAASLCSSRWSSSFKQAFAATRASALTSDSPFSVDELRRLYWLRATVVAERHRLGGGLRACSDHQACRRLGFAVWLRCRGSMSEEIEPEESAPAGESED